MFSANLTDQALECLRSLKRNHIENFSPAPTLSRREQVLLTVESQIRLAEYADVEKTFSIKDDSALVQFCRVYRDLFVNPPAALDGCRLLLSSELCEVTRTRLRIWEAHLVTLLGDIEQAERLYKPIGEIEALGAWASEGLACVALFHFLNGDSKKALKTHFACQQSLDDEPDRFVQTFNASMALRVSLKECDPKAFEYFTYRLDAASGAHEFKRYRLRQLSYRAMILDQSNVPDLADAYWKLAENCILTTESPFEVAQFYLLRGLAHGLAGAQTSALECFSYARNQLARVSAKGFYAAEIDIAEILVELHDPLSRGRSLRESLDRVEEARTLLNRQLKKAGSSSCKLYFEALSYLNYLEFSKVGDTFLPRHSLVLSIMNNYSNHSSLNREVSQYRRIPDFVLKFMEGRVTADRVTGILEELLSIEVKWNDGKIELIDDVLATIPEVSLLLKLATHLVGIQESADREAKLAAREDISKQVAHDIQSPITTLRSILEVSVGMEAELKDLGRAAIQKVASISADLEMSASEKREKERINLSTILMECVREERFRSAESQGKYVFKGHVEEGLICISDPSEIIRAVTNVLSNARDAALANGSGTVHFEAQRVHDGVEISVSDSGPGIAPEIHEAIGLRGATFGKIGGKGLGLYQARLAVEGANGRLKVFRNSVLGGAKICMSVPT